MRIDARIERLANGNPGDARPVGNGVNELRIDYGPGYRGYFVQRGNVLIILLCGGDKASQRRDIAKSDWAGGKVKAMKLSKYDIADYLDNDEMVAAYLDLAFESGDLSRIAAALGNVARARGMTKIAKATGLSREQLYKTLSADGKPELATVLKVMAAFGGGLKSNFRVPKRRAAKVRKAA